jgi:hypothetical protein
MLNENTSMSTNTTFVSIHPAEPIHLTSDLNIAGLIDLFYEIDTTPSSQTIALTLNMMGLSGIDLTPWPTLTQILARCTLAIVFEQSQIGFYRNGTEISDNECSADMIYKYGDDITNFFNLKGAPKIMSLISS